MFFGELRADSKETWNVEYSKVRNTWEISCDILQYKYTLCTYFKHTHINDIFICMWST